MCLSFNPPPPPRAAEMSSLKASKTKNAIMTAFGDEKGKVNYGDDSDDDDSSYHSVEEEEEALSSEDDEEGGGRVSGEESELDEADESDMSLDEDDEEDDDDEDETSEKLELYSEVLPVMKERCKHHFGSESFDTIKADILHEKFRQLVEDCKSMTKCSEKSEWTSYLFRAFEERNKVTFTKVLSQDSSTCFISGKLLGKVYVDAHMWKHGADKSKSRTTLDLIHPKDGAISKPEDFVDVDIISFHVADVFVPLLNTVCNMADMQNTKSRWYSRFTPGAALFNFRQGSCAREILFQSHPPMRNENAMKITIQNVVSTATFGCRVDLVSLAWRYSGKYVPKSFAACQLRIDYPKTTALVFASGKIVCAGARSESMSRLALYVYMRMICKIHPTARLRGVKIQNIVGSGLLNSMVRLRELHQANFSKVQYDPDIFPGARISLSINEMHASVFLSGKVIISGGKNREDMKKSWYEVYEICKHHFRTDKNDLESNVEHRDITITLQSLKNV